MPFVGPGVYVVNCEDRPYEVETAYYLEFQIYSALISIEKLSKSKDDEFDTKHRYYHYYTDHLLYCMGQIANRFVITQSDKSINLERKKANQNDYQFTEDKYPILSDKHGRNTIEHIDEHDNKTIGVHRGVGGFNVIDDETEQELVNALRTRRNSHIYTLDLLNKKIMIFRSNREIDIELNALKEELVSLSNRVQQVKEMVQNPFT